MSTKQPRLTAMSDLPTPGYLVTFELIRHIRLEDSSGMERFVLATLVREIYCNERPIDGFSLRADAKVNGDFVNSNVKPQQRLTA